MAWVPCKRDAAKKLIGIIFLALSVWLILRNATNTTSLDSRFSLYAAMSLIREGNLDLNEYAQIKLFSQAGAESFADLAALDFRHGHLYDYFPIGAPIIAAPFLFVVKQAYSLFYGVDLFSQIKTERPIQLEKDIASLLVALTTVLLYLLARRHLDRGRALVLSGVFAFGTSAWSTAGLALWQHGPVILATMFVLLIIERNKADAWAWVGGLALAFTYVVRPTSSLLIVMVMIDLAIERRRLFVPFLVMGMTVAIWFALRNQLIYGQYLPPYNQFDRIGQGRNFLNALTGSLISPGRGLFLFTPVLLIAFVGMALKVRNHAWTVLDSCLVAYLILHLLVIASFPHWIAGHSLGPRFMTDTLPVYFYFMIYAFKIGKELRHQSWLLGSFVCLALFSVFVQYRLVFFRGPLYYNKIPNIIDKNESRVWDWRDIQFLRCADGKHNVFFRLRPDY